MNENTIEKLFEMEREKTPSKKNLHTYTLETLEGHCSVVTTKSKP